MRIQQPLRIAAVAVVVLVPLLAACGSKPAEQPRVPSAYCDSILGEDVESPQVDRMTCVAEVKRLQSRHDLRPYDANGDGLLNVEESIAAFGPALDLVRAVQPATTTAKPTITTAEPTTAEPTTSTTRPQIPTSPPATSPPAPTTTRPEFPGPPDVAPGANREWARYGPYSSLWTCGQSQGAWPERTSECFMFEGQAYYYGIRQATR